MEKPGGVGKSLTEKAEGSKTKSSGLPIPRFASLRTEPINLRTGPGERYPVDWVYNRRNLPVEVVDEFDTWRRIRDPDGSEGWVHQAMLTGNRTGIVRGAIQVLRQNSGDAAAIVAHLETDVIVHIQRCLYGAYCEVKVGEFLGWLRRDQMWGVYPNEVVE